MSKKVVEVEGIGPAYAEKLGGAGILTLEDLLNHGATGKGRKQLAEKTGISGKLVLKWVSRADLARIKGIGGEYADLLELAGVDSVPELAQRNAPNLHDQMTKVNAEKKAVRQLPSQKQVDEWVAQAKMLPRLVTY